MSDDAEHFFACVGHQLGAVPQFALRVVAASNLVVEALELSRARLSQRPRAMQRLHGGGDCDRDDEKRDDLQRFHAIDPQRPTGGEEVQIDQQQRDGGGDGARPTSAVPGGNCDGRHEKQKARRRSISPRRQAAGR